LLFISSSLATVLVCFFLKCFSTSDSDTFDSVT
jgi:hypothetical protein